MGRILTVRIQGKHSQEVRDSINQSKEVKSSTCAEDWGSLDDWDIGS